MIAHASKITPEHSLMFLSIPKETQQQLMTSRYYDKQLFDNLTTVLERLIGMTDFLTDSAILWEESEHYNLNPEPLLQLAKSLNLDANDALIITNGLLKINDEVT